MRRRLLPLMWDALLGALALTWSLILIRSFFPGRINVDIGNQYRQAIGEIPLSDWHPPVMSAVWHVLIRLTGEPGSLLVLQVAMLGAACWLLGVIIHRTSGSMPVSLLGPAIALTPWVVSQMTTLWKDTQMAVALALAVVLLLIARLTFRSAVRSVPRVWLLCMPAVLLLVYALGLRKNALFALVPIAVYIAYWLVRVVRERISAHSLAAGRRCGEPGNTGHTGLTGHTGPEREPQSSRQQRSRLFRLISPRWSVPLVSLLVLLVLGGGSVGVDAAIAARHEVRHTGQISQIFLDDVMFSVPEAELDASDAPRELIDHIDSARAKCLNKDEIWNAYWACYGRGVTGRAFSPIAYPDELKNLWLTHVVTHPLRYAAYRAEVFSRYFFTSSLEYWEFGWNKEAHKVGYPLGDPNADDFFKPYVVDVSLGVFPMLFTPWIWSLLAAGLLVVAWRRRSSRTRADGELQADAELGADGTAGYLGEGGSNIRLAPDFRAEITMLATSALCYVVGYFPIVPANHFRYTFWPALAVTMALVLWAAMGAGQGRRGRRALIAGRGRGARDGRRGQGRLAPHGRNRPTATPGTRTFSGHGAEPTRLGGSYE